MTITLPEGVVEQTGLSEARIKLEVAVALFERDVLTLAQGAAVAGLHRMQLQEELARRQVPLHYGTEELREDLKTLNIPFE